MNIVFAWIPTSENPEKGSRFVVEIGRFVVNIDLDEIRHGNELPFSLEQDEKWVEYCGMGELSIIDNQFDNKAPLERSTIRGISPFTLKILRMFVENDDPKCDVPMMECFETKEHVPATPENIIKAIQWCLANQNFMKSKEGI